jgi:hypothetical protein
MAKPLVPGTALNDLTDHLADRLAGGHSAWVSEHLLAMRAQPVIVGRARKNLPMVARRTQFCKAHAGSIASHGA